MGHCIRAIIGTHRVIQKLETDYFGGTGTQGGVLYENGQISIAPRSGEGTINILLRELGIRRAPNKDEFDSLNLGIYRRMDE